MKVLTADGCAWRGIYLYTNNRKQLGRIVLDPKDGISPTLTIAIPIGWYKSCAKIRYPKLLEVKIPMPRMRWHLNMGPTRLWLYGKFRRFWHRVDGRYSQIRKKNKTRN